jgi:hypothetical protein
VNATEYLGYIGALNFRPTDTVCITFIKGKQVEDSFQLFSRLTDPVMIAELEDRNDSGESVYICMAPFGDGCKSREKKNVTGVRHVFCDDDKHGTATLAKLREDIAAGIMPKPAIAIQTSSDENVQIIWHVNGDFDVPRVEATNRAIQQRYDTDKAVVDAARLLRVGGCVNNKYSEKP